MSFIFPKRVLRKGDVLDPTEMNEDYVPASELYSGNLNAHNFNSSTVFPPATNALFTYSYDQQVVGHNMGEAGSFSTPDVGATADAVVISNAGTWEHVISTTITTGNSTLWITGFVQYFWLFWGTLKYDYGSAKAHEFASGGEHNPPGGGGEYASLGRPAAVQFALRIDGRIVEWTITGKQNPYESPAIPLRPANARTVSDAPRSRTASLMIKCTHSIGSCLCLRCQTTHKRQQRQAQLKLRLKQQRRP